ncbi:MAG: DUF1553 domain-containing protein [Pirellulales bacterium]|nr:DUF1553 domain-containing protein [Pirellulales bacterium]
MVTRSDTTTRSAEPFARIAAVLLLTAAAAGWFTGAAQAERPLEYNRDIRPVLADTCFKCHGPDSASREADLRLDLRQAAIDSGAIVPGDPDSSMMVERILEQDPDSRMPPAQSHKTLSDAQKQLLVRWIREGAEYQPHWSLVPPQQPGLPEVKNTAWIRTPIDRFILARLESEGLTPAPEADRRTLARRVALDLTGLPPSPELVEAFVADASPDACEKLVDQLLQSPAWGEHRGRYWLDYARYADTHGIHFDNFREMWSYRQWVIEAMNRNMPFDQFTVENLAGDLLPGATLDQRIGSGFNRCNMTTNEGGIIDEEYAVLYARDRTETTSQVWLGLTVGCAVCHEHKFDPISQREFYELSAFFNNTTQPVRDGNVKDTPPVLIVPRSEDRERYDSLKPLLAEAKQKVEARRQSARPDFDAWLSAASPDVFAKEISSDGLHLHAPLDQGAGPAATVIVDGQPRQVPVDASAEWQPGHTAAQAVKVSSRGVAEIAEAGDFEADMPFSAAAWVHLPANDGNGAIAARMDDSNGYTGWDFWVEGRRVGTHIIHKWSDDALKVVSRDQVPANEWTHVAFTYDGSKKAAGVKIYIDGQEKPANVQADALKGTIRTEVPLKIGQRHRGSVLSGAAIQDLRVIRRVLPPNEVAALARSTRFAAVVARPADQRTDAEKNELYQWWLASLDGPYKHAADELARLEREHRDIEARGTIAHVMEEKQEPAKAYVLFRGAYDQRRDEVTPGVPEVLPDFPQDYPRNRLGLARWLLLPDHPLTARVTVNRFWQEIFGTGIVETSGDFGVAGRMPSHPELLDWLAVEFRETGWDIKRLFKLIVTSAAYRQSAAVTPEKLEKDPGNRLLSRGPRFRMDAEMVRDCALAAGGLLVRKLGGPSVKPYQPPGVWEAIAMNVSNTRSYEQGTGEDLYRRSLYTFWKRQAPPASMDLLNAPAREFCVVRRERTNTPLQALVTLNDPQFVEAARHLAQSAIRESGKGFEDRIRWVGLRLLARDFRPEELEILRRSRDELAAFYKAHPGEARLLIAYGESKADAGTEPAELAAWTMLCNQLMNLDEVLNK